MQQCNIEVVTPLLAQTYLKDNDKNRKPNMAIVGYYAKIMKNGAWELNGDTIKFASTGRLIDGQHRLLACIEANTPFKTFVIRGVEESVFATLDQGYKRTSGQTFALANIPNANAISAAIHRFLIMGVSKVTSMGTTTAGVNGGISNGRRKFSTKECMDVYYTDPTYWQELYKAAAAMYKRYNMMTAAEIVSITAHLHQNCKYDLGYVLDFFNQLFYEECTKMMVIRELRRKLISNKTGANRMNEQIRTQCIRKAWDYYKKGEDRNLIRWQKGIEQEKPFE